MAGAAGMIGIVGLKAIGTCTSIRLQAVTVVATRHLAERHTVIAYALIAGLAGANTGCTTVAMVIAWRSTDGPAASVRDIRLVTIVAFTHIGFDAC